MYGRAAYQFVGQLDSDYPFYSEPSVVQAWMQSDGNAWEGRRHFTEGPNFGGGDCLSLFEGRA